MIYVMNSFFWEDIVICKTYQLFLSGRQANLWRNCGTYKGNMHVSVSRGVCVCVCVYTCTHYIHVHTYITTILKSQIKILSKSE